jgi:hypothetical protein
MLLRQAQPRSSGRLNRMARDVMAAPGPRVGDDIAVDVALSVLVDVVGVIGGVGGVGGAMQDRTLDVSPVVDAHGYALGVLACSR